MFTVDRVMGQLRYEFEATGVPPDQLHAVVLRSADAEGRWSVTRRLSGPGAASGSGVFSLDAALQSRLERGELQLDVFTRDHPLGAAGATIRLPG